jgi:uncharacterized protein (DUF2235 family)
MALYAFDGTWNVRDSKTAIDRLQPLQYGPDAAFRRETAETNVHRFREFYGVDRCEYVQGVGTRFSLLGRIVGGAFGVGGKWRIRRMYRRLCERYHTGDTHIDIIGFSRGAALAVHFANVIHTHGIRKPDGRKHLALWYDRILGWSFRMPKRDPATDVPSPAITFVGLWDTVASFGLPVGPFRNRQTPRWRVQTVPNSVRRSFHAMSLDEVRATFALVRPEREDLDEERHYEVWFRGVHSNVGGGYTDRGLSDIALAWMMEMYLWTLDKETEQAAVPKGFEQALRRLEPVPESDDAIWQGSSLETLEPDADGELGRPSDIRRQAWRVMPPGALVHHSVSRRARNLLLDHHTANRRLLRPIPGDARPVYDPPFAYSRTPRQEATAVAIQAFFHIPIRAAPWLTVTDPLTTNDLTVVRSDDWVALGQRRRDLPGAKTRDTFVHVATEWLLSGRRPVSELTLPATFPDVDGTPVEGQVAAQWVVDVLLALEAYVPALRDYTPPASTTRGDGPAKAGHYV